MTDGASDAAARYVSESVSLWRELIAADPRNASFRDQFASSPALAAAITSERGDFALAQTDFDAKAAEASLESARDILRALVQSHPENTAYKDSLKRTEQLLALFPED